LATASRPREGECIMNYCFYFLAGVLFISGVSVLASTTDDNSIFFGACMLLLSAGSFYLGGKIDE